MIKDKTIDKKKGPDAPAPPIDIHPVCDFTYLVDMMGKKKNLIKEIMDVFLKQVPAELNSMNEAVREKDYVNIKGFAHTMKSSVSIMGISSLTPVLKEMEDLATGLNPPVNRDARIKELNEQVNAICKQAIGEIEKERTIYI